MNTNEEHLESQIQDWGESIRMGGWGLCSAREWLPLTLGMTGQRLDASVLWISWLSLSLAGNWLPHCQTTALCAALDGVGGGFLKIWGKNYCFPFWWNIGKECSPQPRFDEKHVNSSVKLCRYNKYKFKKKWFLGLKVFTTGIQDLLIYQVIQTFRLPLWIFQQLNVERV